MDDIEEISLYELILIIIKGWKLILISVLVALGLAIGIYLSNNTPTYSSNLTGTIFFTKDQITDIGQVSLPYTKSEEFAPILKDEEFIQFVSNELDIDANVVNSTLTINSPNVSDFMFNVTSSNQEYNELLLSKIEDFSEKYINYIASKNAVEQVNYTQNLKLDSLEKQLNEKIRSLDYLNTELQSTDKFLGNNVNPAYSSLLSYITRFEFEKKELEFAIDDVKEYSPIINNFIATNTSFTDYLTSAQELSISNIVIEFKEVESIKSYRFNAKTLFPISIILGGMLGIFIIFFKNYWTSNFSKKN